MNKIFWSSGLAVLMLCGCPDTGNVPKKPPAIPEPKASMAPGAEVVATGTPRHAPLSASTRVTTS